MGHFGDVELRLDRFSFNCFLDGCLLAIQEEFYFKIPVENLILKTLVCGSNRHILCGKLNRQYMYIEEI